MKQLKVGDKVYAEQYGKIQGVYTIVRVTKATAITKDGTKFRINTGDSGWVDTVGSRSPFSPTYWLETKELREKAFRQRLIYKCQNIDFDSLSNEQLENILNQLS